MLDSFHGFRKNLRKIADFEKVLGGKKSFSLQYWSSFIFLQAEKLTVYSVVEQPLSFNSNP